MDTALVWFRRDLRLADHPALGRALASAERVLPIYIHDPDAAPGGAARWWLHHSLKALDSALRERGSRLIVRRGETRAVLAGLSAETGAGQVYWHRRYEPAAIALDAELKRSLRAAGHTVETFNGSLLYEPWEIKRGGGEPYRVFTPFWKALQKLGPEPDGPPAPAALPPVPETVAGLAVEALELLPRIPWDAGFYARWQPGAAAAERRLADFIADGLADYKTLRDRPDLPATSRLSPHLHFGELSPRQIARALRRGAGPGAEAGMEAYLRELAWREFAHHLLYHFPHTVDRPLDARYAAFPWAGDYGAALRAWQRGRTGIPLVDAGMRELWHTGWMHNRVRMVAASFLTKNLLIPWQEGARWFMDTLVDADLANNSLGWQWTAGCGADAAPYFRIFNPVLQGARFDPDGAYVRRWVPELAGLPAARIHQPGQTPDYPAPIVDLAGSRDRALQAYAAIKGG